MRGEGGDIGEENWGREDGGTMGVYLKHGDPVAEGCLGAGMNKTLMAHKTQRLLLRAPLHVLYSCWTNQSAPKSPNTGKTKRGEKVQGIFQQFFFFFFF